MWTDVVDLRDFYASPLGGAASRALRRRMRVIWPDLGGCRLLGVGYATPYLRAFRDDAERIAAVMPAGQGVLHWPPDGPGQSLLADEAELPFPDNFFDRVLLVHALEFSEQWRGMMREVWRVMAGGGRLMVVVPNRRGLWARFERTPFGRGHAYTPAQLSRLLRETLFTPLRTHAGLYMLPSGSRMARATAPAWEKLGGHYMRGVGGVFMIEAGKQLYAGHSEAARARPRRRAYSASPSRS
ncbi:MAG: class I SAM-dependent methyltransferase [Alphaproteobacteria bacterium]